MTEELVVTFNAGSSSLRCGVFRMADDGPLQIRNFHIRGLPDSMILTEKDLCAETEIETVLGTPKNANNAHPETLTHMFTLLDGLSGLGAIAGFSHRIVHGGAKYSAPTLIEGDVLEQLKSLVAGIARLQTH